MHHLLTLAQLSINEIKQILNQALALKAGKLPINFQQQKIIANLFFEPSTRTHYSFDVAANRLGCQTINFVADHSSLKKGETFYDTVQTFAAFNVDALVIRHPQNDYYQALIDKVKVPIINGGAGASSHPTQSLLDLMTIQEHFGKLADLKVLMVGDLKYSRVAKSNIAVMQRLKMKVYTAGPPAFQLPNVKHVKLDNYLPKIDVVMLLRYQFERFVNNEQYHLDYLKSCQLTSELVAMMKPTAIILHPAPFNRGIEITDEVVECQQSRIFEQIKNGVYMRMAILEQVLSQPMVNKQPAKQLNQKVITINYDHNL